MLWADVRSEFPAQAAPQCMRWGKEEINLNWRLISSRPKSVTELKTNPELSPCVLFSLLSPSASCPPGFQCLSWLCWGHPPGMWAGHGQDHQGSETPPGMLQSLWRAGSATDEVEGIQGTASPISVAQNRNLTVQENSFHLLSHLLK